MAHSSTGGVLGFVDHTDYREITKLKLSKEHFPFPCTLQQLVLQRYADPDRSATPGQEMETGELLAYLRNSADSDQPPLDSVLAQTELIGDPALPTAAQVATLRWLATSWDNWRTDYPLEEPLTQELQRLRPLLAIAAVTDFDFHTPGEHPLHRILDALQEAAVGWHPQLARLGQVVSNLVTTAVADCLATLEGGEVTLEQVASEVERAVARNAQRVERMTQRMAAGEEGRARTGQARQRAASMLNALLQRYPATAEIGVFIRGPWYDSAQLVWLKFGEDSTQWQQFCNTTRGLLESLQNLDAGDEPARQALMERINNLPDELRRWALSQQNDSSALEDMLARLEFDHLRLMRFQQLELVNIPAIETGTGNTESSGNMDLPLGYKAGEWFLISQGKKQVRMQLVARDPESGQLLFANCAGLKEGTRPEMEFSTQLTTGEVVALDSGASFSRSLAMAVAIDTTEALQAFSGVDIATGEPAAGIPATTRDAAGPDADDQEIAVAAGPSDDPGAATQRTITGTTSAATEFASSDPGEPDLIPEIATGTWMGFHDGETPLLAKLAMHDRERGLYIFTNREGIKLRQLQQTEFLDLIDQGLVDMMESRVNFRDLVKTKKQHLGD